MIMDYPLIFIDEEQLLALMKEADLAIVPSSGILLESLAAGCRIISGMYTDNQQFIYSAYRDAGCFIDAGNFDWTNGKFPEFTEPSAGYHGLVYHEALGNAAFIAKVRIEGLRDYGAALSPFNAFQIIQGLETLPIRIRRHSDNALALAQWLESQEEVAWVNYPGLKSSKYYLLGQEYLP